MKERIDKIRVSIQFEGVDTILGQIIREGNNFYFRYTQSYLDDGYNISPFQLKFDNSIQTPKTSIFNGLFGVFNDSQPDGWGRLLMDRFLMNNGWQLNDIDPLLRLSLIGSNGIGALTYRPVLHKKIDKEWFTDLDSVYHQSRDIYENDSNDIELLFHLGGSSGGARPKVWLNYNEQTDSFSQKPKKGYNPWIIKFPSSQDLEGIAMVEFVYYLMATKAGIAMNHSKLITTKKGNQFFGTKRFDIIDNHRLHMISAAGLLNDNYRLSNIDYGHIMDAAYNLNPTIAIYEDIIRLGIFNVLSNNKDDHSKNFSFLMNKNGEWDFAPAYDITFSTSSHGYQSTSVDGESKNITIQHFLNLATHFGVVNINNIIEQVIESLGLFVTLANQYNVPKQTTKYIQNTIQQNISNFKLK